MNLTRTAQILCLKYKHTCIFNTYVYLKLYNRNINLQQWNLQSHKFYCFIKDFHTLSQWSIYWTLSMLNFNMCVCGGGAGGYFYVVVLYNAIFFCFSELNTRPVSCQTNRIWKNIFIDNILRTYSTKYFPYWNIFNTLHTVCFMHGLSIYEIKRIYHRAYFFRISYWSLQHLTNFLEIRNNNTSPNYRAKTVVIFSQLLSFNLNYCPWPQTFKKMCMFTCYPMLWQDTAWYILTIGQKMEFVFRINHVLKNLILKILKIYF